MTKDNLRVFIKTAKNWEMTEWEENFVISLEDILTDETLNVTKKQERVINCIEEKYEGM